MGRKGSAAHFKAVGVIYLHMYNQNDVHIMWGSDMRRVR